MSLFRRGTVAAVVATLTSHAAVGHTLLLTPGEVVVEECGATVDLEIAVEDFIHWYGIGPDSNGFMSTRSLAGILEQHALALHRIFVIRDVTGSPLSSEPFNFHFDWPTENQITWGNLRSLRARYSTRFTYPCSPRFLTFQLLMAGENPGLYWQAVLHVRGSAEQTGGIVRLTSRGNSETVEPRWTDKGATFVHGPGASESWSAAGVSGLKEICADINIAPESIEVRIAMPLSLLQTWLMADTNLDEVVDLHEQKSARTEIEPLLAGALSVENEGRKWSGRIMEVAFLPIDAKDESTQSQQVSLFTGRVITRLRFGPFDALEQADFQWNLFNNAVFSVVAMIGGNRHEFSSFQPKYHWRRGS